MKTAILINGNIRTLDKCKQNILDTFKHLNPDYFVSTYTNLWGYHPYNKQSMNFYDDPVITVDEVVELYKDFNVKGFVIDSNEDLETYYNMELSKFYVSMRDFKSSFLQYYKAMCGVGKILAYEKHDNINYDIIIKIRSDIINNSILDIDLSNLDKTIIISYGNVYPNDCIMISSKNNMKAIFENMVSEFYEMRNPLSAINAPHGVFQSAIEREQLNIVSYPIMNHVIRANKIQYY